MSDAWAAIREAMATARAVRHGAESRAALDAALAGLRDRDDLPPAGPALLDLVERAAAGPVVVAQLGQTLDGRIATATGHSHYVNGPEALDHLHRLRALVDAVAVGAGTAVDDDPSLTTRRVAGPNPVRVLLDPNGRVPGDRRLFRDGAAPTLTVGPARAGAGSLELPGGDSSPAAILAALAARRLDVVLVEGGAGTVSRFLEAGRIDRLHLLVAPTLLGSGRPGIVLPEAATMDGARRFEARRYALGEDTLFDLTPAA
ncbi:MAG: RibD family protein [Thalassobaculum sp.]|uniref:RibD family protein n=1 Tax=Thalassobaculum sp. TaxID=2022740 RepID=UPI0032ECBA3C